MGEPKCVRARSRKKKSEKPNSMKEQDEWWVRRVVSANSEVVWYRLRDRGLDSVPVTK